MSVYAALSFGAMTSALVQCVMGPALGAHPAMGPWSFSVFGIRNHPSFNQISSQSVIDTAYCICICIFEVETYL